MNYLNARKLSGIFFNVNKIYANISRMLEKNANISRMLEKKTHLADHYRSSRPEVLCEKGVLRNFTKFTGKHLRQSLFLIKLQALGLQLY